MSAPWWEGPLVGFDLETTGPDPETARIVTATVVRDVPGQKPTVATWLADPGIEIPDGAAAVHGVTTERARAEGEAAVDVVAQLLAVLKAEQDPLVAFNGAYDFTVLDREARRHGFAPLDPAVVVDPFVLDKQYDRYRRGKRTLGAMCEQYGVSLTNAHDATADALAAVGLVREMGQVFGLPDVAELHVLQVGWRAEQCASLASYFARQGRPQVIRGEWPVIPAAEGSAA